MTNNDNAAPSKGFVELLGQALVNPELRAKVLTSPEQLAAEYDLLPSEVSMLRRTNDAAFEHAASKLGGETAALVKGFFDGDQIQTVTRRRDSAPQAKAA